MPTGGRGEPIAVPVTTLTHAYHVVCHQCHRVLGCYRAGAFGDEGAIFRAKHFAAVHGHGAEVKRVEQEEDSP